MGADMARQRLSASKKEPYTVAVVMPMALVNALDQLRSEMQTQTEGRVVSRSEAIRRVVASATGKTEFGSIFEEETATN